MPAWELAAEWVWDQCHIYTVVITVLYGFLLLIAGYQLGRILYFRCALVRKLALV